MLIDDLSRHHLVPDTDAKKFMVETERTLKRFVAARAVCQVLIVLSAVGVLAVSYRDMDSRMASDTFYTSFCVSLFLMLAFIVMSVYLINQCRYLSDCLFNFVPMQSIDVPELTRLIEGFPAGRDAVSRWMASGDSIRERDLEVLRVARWKFDRHTRDSMAAARLKAALGEGSSPGA